MQWGTMKAEQHEEIKEKISILIETIQEYNETHREELTAEISEKIRGITASKSYVRTIIEETEIGQKLFRALRQYIDTRYASLLELVRSDLGVITPPSANGRLSYEAGILGKFPVSQPALARGVTEATLRESLQSFRTRIKKQRTGEVAETETAEKNRQQIGEITQKKEVLERTREKLREEVKSRPSGEIPLENLLSRRKRLLTKEKASNRVIALTTLILDHVLKIKERDGKLLIEAKNSE